MTLAIAITLFPTTPSTSAADMNYTVAIVSGVLALSVVWFYFPKYGGVHWFQGPVRNIDAEKSGNGSSSEVYVK